MSGESDRVYHQKAGLSPLMTAWNYYLADSRDGKITLARDDLLHVAKMSVCDDVIDHCLSFDEETERQIAIMKAGHGYSDAEEMFKPRKILAYIKSRNDLLETELVRKLREHKINVTISEESSNTNNPANLDW